MNVSINFDSSLDNAMLLDSEQLINVLRYFNFEFCVRMVCPGTDRIESHKPINTRMYRLVIIDFNSGKYLKSITLY